MLRAIALYEAQWIVLRSQRLDRELRDVGMGETGTVDAQIIDGAEKPVRLSAAAPAQIQG